MLNDANRNKAIEKTAIPEYSGSIQLKMWSKSLTPQKN